MFMARQQRSARHRSARTGSGREALRQSTLERRYDFHLGEAFRAALQGSHDKAAGHSERALLISRELCADATKARMRLGWEPETKFEELVTMMVQPLKRLTKCLSTVGVDKAIG